MSCTVHSPSDSLAQPTCILVYIECNPAPGGSPFELSLGLRSNSRVLPPPSLLRVSCVVVRPRFCLGSPQFVWVPALGESIHDYHLMGQFRRVSRMMIVGWVCLDRNHGKELALVGEKGDPTQCLKTHLVNTSRPVTPWVQATQP